MPEAGDVNIMWLWKKHDKGNPVETLDFPADTKELACFKQAYPDDDLSVLLGVVTVNNHYTRTPLHHLISRPPSQSARQCGPLADTIGTEMNTTDDLTQLHQLVARLP